MENLPFWSSSITATTHRLAFVVESPQVASFENSAYVQLNCVAAVLLVLNALVKVFAATSIVVAPSALGVKVAV